MKRSEAEKIIDDCYGKFVDDWLASDMNNLSGFEGLSSRILNALLDAGMLPPGIYVPKGPFETVEYEWEDE